MKKKSKKSKPKKPQRFDYCLNHQMIEAAILDYLRENKRLPTQTEIAKRVGLNSDTVHSHWQELSIKNFMPHYRALSPRVMTGLLSRAAAGNAMAAKLWMQIVEGFSERVKIGDDDKKPLADDLEKMSDEELKSELERLEKVK